MKAASRFETLAQEFDQRTISTFGRPYMGLITRLVLANSEAIQTTHAQADMQIDDWATSSTRVARAPLNARLERLSQRTLRQLRIP